MSRLLSLVLFDWEGSRVVEWPAAEAGRTYCVGFLEMPTSDGQGSDTVLLFQRHTSASAAPLSLNLWMLIDYCLVWARP